MLAKVRDLTRYKVIVLSLRDKRSKNFQDDTITVNDRDTFFGYAYPRHIVGKFIDLWFNNPKEKDPENFVTFGRITSITPAYFGPGLIYGTKLGRFYVEEMPCNVSDQATAASGLSATSGSGRSQVKARASSSLERGQAVTRVPSQTGFVVRAAGKLTPRSGVVVADPKTPSVRKS